LVLMSSQHLFAGETFQHDMASVLGVGVFNSDGRLLLIKSSIISHRMGSRRNVEVKEF